MFQTDLRDNDLNPPPLRFIPGNIHWLTNSTTLFAYVYNTSRGLCERLFECIASLTCSIDRRRGGIKTTIPDSLY